MTDDVRRIADAVLYEGYVLWPYRRTALKNQRRWTFGGVYPRAHSEGREDDPWTMRTECLLEGGEDASVAVSVRFLHVVERQAVDADGVSVDELTAAGERHLAWDEAVEREVVVPELALDALPAAVRAPIAVAGAHEEEELRHADGGRAGALVRRWQPLEGEVVLEAERLAPGLVRLVVTIANTTPWEGSERQDAQRRTLCSTHTVLRARDAAGFHSLTDPPEALRDVAAACRNEGTWPVLVGETGQRDTLLSSPIILEDHPAIAPESPGDLFDGGEIDGLLTLSILSMTDSERADMRDCDPRTRAILERTEALTEEQLMALHGRVRELGMERAR